MHPRVIIVAVALTATGCRGGGSTTTTATTATTVAAAAAGTATTAKLPSVDAAAIPGVAPEAVHAKLRAAGFMTRDAVSNSTTFVTTTSTRSDATVTTYGRTSAEVSQVVAEANRPVAAAVLGTVSGVLVQPVDAKGAAKWLQVELKKGPSGVTQPRSSTATYGGQPFALLITSSTATLTVGRIKAS